MIYVGKIISYITRVNLQPFFTSKAEGGGRSRGRGGGFAKAARYEIYS